MHPDVEAMVRKALASCTASAIDYIVTCTYRSSWEQNDLYASGRTKPGKVVTNAKGGQSAHNYVLGQKPASLAVDIVPCRNGKPVWGLSGNGMDENPADDETDDLELWQRLRKCFEDAGMVSGSRWKSIQDWPHFEHPRTKEIMS
ncbi:MAG: M15 family metallopeptidase [Verrucomicrobiota bacterium]